METEIWLQMVSKEIYGLGQAWMLFGSFGLFLVSVFVDFKVQM